MTEYVALETREAIKNAVRIWAKKFRVDAKAFPFRGNKAHWDSLNDTWGFFNDPDGIEPVHAYWNAFGRMLSSGSRSILVEINPPRKGINLNVQGLIAVAPDGSRWVLHQGRLHPGKIRISEDMFDAVSRHKRVRVKFTTGQTVDYHLVANIDASPAILQSQLSEFVALCDVVRRRYVDGRPQVAEVFKKEGLFPETPGKYDRGPQAGMVVIKKHADVWRALTSALVLRGIPHSNGRVARWGPDILTNTAIPVLFEIKSGGGASELQRAVGQLLLYEKLLGANHKKVLVMPEQELPQHPVINEAIQSLGIFILPYAGERSGVEFNKAKLSSYLSDKGFKVK